LSAKQNISLLKQQSFLSILMSVLQQGAGFVALYFVAQYMGPKPLGIIAAALAFSSIFMSFSDLGYSLAHLKKISEGRNLGKCIGTYAVTQTFLTVLAGIAFLSTIYYFKLRGLNLPVPEEHLNVLIITMAAAIVSNLGRIPQNTFAARLEKVKEWSSLISAKVLASGLRVLTAVLGFSVTYLALSNLAGAVAGLLIAIWFLRKLPIEKFDPALFRDYTRYALPAYLIGLCSSLAFQLDTVFLSMLSNIEQVGFYSAAKAIVQILTLVSVIFISLLLPTYSRMHAEGDLEGIRNLASRVERYISFPLMAIAVFIFFFSEAIAETVLGSTFQDSSAVIKILALSTVLIIITQPYSAQLMGMNRVVLATWLSVLVLLLNIGFYFLFIPNELLGFHVLNLGAAGAALSLLVSNLITTLLFRYYAFRLTRSKPNYIIVSHLAMSLLVFGLMYAMIRNWPYLNNLFTLAGIGLLGGIAYLLLLFVFRLFGRQDLYFYVDLVNPKKLANYIKDEIRE
jgi:O-antigen/teichoic acid export membrane protein